MSAIFADLILKGILLKMKSVVFWFKFDSDLFQGSHLTVSPHLVQILARHRAGDNLMYEPIMTLFSMFTDANLRQSDSIN